MENPQPTQNWLRLIVVMVAIAGAGLWFSLHLSVRSQTGITQADLDELREEFPKFIQERMVAENQTGNLRKINVKTIDTQEDGIVVLTYQLLFDNVIDGENATTSYEAIALINKENASEWKVLKILSQKEILNFLDGTKITPDFD